MTAIWAIFWYCLGFGSCLTLFILLALFKGSNNITEQLKENTNNQTKRGL